MNIVLKHKNILIYGFGKSGKESALFLTKKKAKVFVYDDKKIEESTSYVTIDNDFDFDLIDLVIISPGVNADKSFIIKKIKELKIPIISEIELAYLYF
jgi:UDP-N-acetylmuramoylalanine-D-glutamate ligase